MGPILDFRAIFFSLFLFFPLGPRFTSGKFVSYRARKMRGGGAINGGYEIQNIFQLIEYRKEAIDHK